MENNIMLDLETMGSGSNSAIIAIGAVRFNETEITDRFYEIVDLASSVNAGLFIDPDTVMWWMEQSEAARNQFKKAGETLHSSLTKFSNWIQNDALVWGNGASFDNVILSNAYKLTGIKQPWKFYNDRCYRTIKNLNKPHQNGTDRRIPLCCR